MTLDDVRYLLTHPDKESWNSLASTAPPHGLYLSRVSYQLDRLAGEGSAAGSDRNSEGETEQQEREKTEGVTGTATETETETETATKTGATAEQRGSGEAAGERTERDGTAVHAKEKRNSGAACREDGERTRG